MKIKWFSMFDKNVIRDENGMIDTEKSIKRSWSLAFHDPIFYILVGFCIYLFVITFS